MGSSAEMTVPRRGGKLERYATGTEVVLVGPESSGLGLTVQVKRYRRIKKTWHYTISTWLPEPEMVAKVIMRCSRATIFDLDVSKAV